MQLDFFIAWLFFFRYSWKSVYFSHEGEMLIAGMIWSVIYEKYVKWCMYLSGKLFMCSPEGYFRVYCCTTREINSNFRRCVKLLKKNSTPEFLPFFMSWSDWHGTKVIWIVTMSDPLYHLDLWPHPWHWPWIFKVKFWDSCVSGMGGPIDMEKKGYESIGCWTRYMTLTFDLHPWLLLWVSNVIYHDIAVSGLDGSDSLECIDIKAANSSAGKNENVYVCFSPCAGYPRLHCSHPYLVLPVISKQFHKTDCFLSKYTGQKYIL